MALADFQAVRPFEPDAVRFPIGARVRLTPEGIRHMAYTASTRPRVPYDEHLRGTVRGYGRCRGQIRVQRDGIKSTDCYRTSFWTTEGA